MCQDEDEEDVELSGRMLIDVVIMYCILIIIVWCKLRKSVSGEIQAKCATGQLESVMILCMQIRIDNVM